MADVIKMNCVRKHEELSVIADKMKEEVWSELVCDERKNDNKIIFLCFEEYYFRVNSYVALSILLTEDDNGQNAIITGVGGGSGMSNISWGANKSFAKKGIKFLEQYGFAVSD